MIKLILGDCLEEMKKIPDKSVDLVITSPPYDNLRGYGKEWNFDYKKVIQLLCQLLKDGGVIVWVVGDATINGSETGTSFKQALYFKECGFNLHDTMIYKKNVYPFPPSNRYFQMFEYMFIFSMGQPQTTNLLRTNTKWRVGKKTCRQKDGSMEKMKYNTGKDTRIRDNVWQYETGYRKTTNDLYCFKHPAMFPEKLAKDHILSWSNKNDTILDPMMGSGTVGKMCKLFGRNFIGIEISPEYYKIAQKRINNTMESFL